MRYFPIHAAVLAATFFAAPAFADSYRSGDAAPALNQVSSGGARLSLRLGATELGVSPRHDRDGDAAPGSAVVNLGSGSGPVAFGVSNPAAISDRPQYFTSPRFE